MELIRKAFFFRFHWQLFAPLGPLLTLFSSLNSHSRDLTGTPSSSRPSPERQRLR